ncbi:MAG: V4R domain-containing protein [Longimicrobiales bacterium]
MSTTIEVHGQVLAALPLALLESVRDQDRPVEILEAEDLTASLPRRLGLSGVIATQIRNYQAAAGGRVPFADVANLLRLVLRRPDAASILRETGRRFARRRLGERVPLQVRVLRRSDRLLFLPVRSTARRLLRGITIDSRAVITGRMLNVQMKDSPMAQIGDPACAMYTGVFEELVELYAGRPREVSHAKCIARGDDVCEWAVVAG